MLTTCCNSLRINPKLTNRALRTSRRFAVASSNMLGEWQKNLVTSPQEAQQIARSATRVAVLGIKTEKQADQPAFKVAKYLQDTGAEVVPVPVYYPDVTHILGTPVYRRLVDVPGHIQLVDVFRRPQDLPQHLDDILAAKPDIVWLQSGITNPAFEEQLARAGIRVVSDRCLMVDRRTPPSSHM